MVMVKLFFGTRVRSLECSVGSVLIYVHVYVLHILSVKGTGLDFASPV